MNFLELKIAFNQIGYTLFKARDYRGVGYFIDNGLVITYAGSTIKEVNYKYREIKGESYHVYKTRVDK